MSKREDLDDESFWAEFIGNILTLVTVFIFAPWVLLFFFKYLNWVGSFFGLR